MITVRVTEHDLWIGEGRKTKYYNYKWGKLTCGLNKRNHISKLFSPGTFRVSLKGNKKGKYYFYGNVCNHKFFNLRGQEAIWEKAIGVRSKFAQGALGKGKRFKEEAYYTLTVKKVK